jgi:hypothetical protein
MGQQILCFNAAISSLLDQTGMKKLDDGACGQVGANSRLAKYYRARDRRKNHSGSW